MHNVDSRGLTMVKNLLVVGKGRLAVVSDFTRPEHVATSQVDGDYVGILGLTLVPKRTAQRCPLNILVGDI